ncbi:DUF397 domain-containing protein [Sphaerisporangium rhizosphaerae]|uniref:DUF397 domain-containing protein n=1 Tax=Sphaerisporangium rhizosphaerae TaxID=2269375 RepID=A0ABW2PC87_9ACTN
MDALKWCRSSYSSANGGECVEIAAISGVVAIRDSKDIAQGHLTVTAGAFRAFLARIKV